MPFYRKILCCCLTTMAALLIIAPSVARSQGRPLDRVSVRADVFYYGAHVDHAWHRRWHLQEARDRCDVRDGPRVWHHDPDRGEHVGSIRLCRRSDACEASRSRFARQTDCRHPPGWLEFGDDAAR